MGYFFTCVLPIVAAVFGLYVLVWWLFVRGTPCRSKERLAGKTVIVTGANTGIGKVTATDLAGRGARVIIACRDMSKGTAALSEIKAESGSDNVVLKKLDLASCASIRQFAGEILDEEREVNILICNAGVMFPPYTKTVDGFELTFGVNHLGHFLLTNLLLPRIKESAPGRIIIVSSRAHYHTKKQINYDTVMEEKDYGMGIMAYARSKLANVMFAWELSKRLAGTGVTVYSLHPGVIRTELIRHTFTGWRALLLPLAAVSMSLFSKTPWQGAQTTIHCAVAKEAEGISGKYWSNCCVKEPSSLTKDDEACQKLWDYSAAMVGLDEIEVKRATSMIED